MKKIMICALAVGMFTACSQEETLSTQAPTQISFAGAFVENATRAAVDPSITTANITNFDVWGFMEEPSGKVFDREAVTKSGSDWTYANTQYWVPGKNFYFAAVAPTNKEQIAVDYTNASTLGLGKITFTNNSNGNVDLLYSAVGPVKADEMIASEAPVKFTFHHMLSKVKFTFKNTFTNDNAKIIISNIQMTAPAKGTIDVAQDLWWEGYKWQHDATATDIKLAFGGMADNLTELTRGASVESANECLTIPAQATEEYTVTFNVTVKMGDVVAFENQVKTAHIKGVELERGKAYNFTAELNASNFSDKAEEDPLKPITFAVDVVDGWEVVNNQNITTIVGGNITEMTLFANGVVNGTINLEGEFDGAGHTLSAAEELTDNGLIRPSGTSTIKNVTIDGKNKSTAAGAGVRGIYITKDGTYTIENVIFKDVIYTINVQAPNKAELNVINSTLEGWTSYGSTTTGNFENVDFTVGQYGRFRPYGETTLSGCTFAKDFIIDLAYLASGKKVTFLNCYYDGELITAENISTLVEGYAEGRVAFE